MNVLVLADTFPHALDPWRGPYNRRQMECLAEMCGVTVIDPLPWTKLVRHSRLRELLGKPDETLANIEIRHPVFRYLPLLGRGRHWAGLLRATERALADMPARRFDCVLATFAYPHGLAAKHLAAKLGVPYAIKARGTDLHGLPRSGARRERTAEALQGAAAVVAVSSNLARIAHELGASPEHVTILTNGIDADAFRIVPREQARSELALEAGEKIVLFVGSLVPVKGLDVLLNALARMPSDRRPLLAVSGKGPLQGALERRAASLGLGNRVRFIGHLGRQQVNQWMNAADALALSSHNEGCPNVVLEALACGTPVVATRVGAVPDLLNESCGLTSPPGDSTALAARLEEALGRTWDRQAIRSRVDGMSWRNNAGRLYEVLERIVGNAGVR